MSRTVPASLAFVAVATAVPSIAQAQPYRQVFDYQTMTNNAPIASRVFPTGFTLDVDATIAGVGVIDDQLYATISYPNATAGAEPAITVGPNDQGEFTEFIGPSAFFTSPAPANGFITGRGQTGSTNGALFFANYTTGAKDIYTVDTNQSGGNPINRVATQAEIESFNAGNPFSFDGQTVDGNGNLIFYLNDNSDADNESIVTADTSGGLSYLANQAQLDAAIDQPEGQLVTIDELAAGGNTLYFGDNSRGVYSLDTLADQPGDTIQQVIDAATINAASGGSSFNIDDLLVGEDGLVYIHERSNGILSFDPSDAENTATSVLSSEELDAGPAGSDNIDGLVWHDGELHWYYSTNGGSQVGGLYAVPEPGSLAVLAVGGMGLMLRRRRA